MRWAVRHGVGRSLLAALAVLACAVPAAGQQQPASLRPRLHAATGVNANLTGAAPSPTRSPLPAPVTPVPAPGTAAPTSSASREATTAPAAATPAPTTPAIASALSPTLNSAVQSRWSRPATIARSTAGQCREQCALSRNQCAGGAGDTSQCDPGWTRCLSDCAGLSYGRGP